MIIHMQLRPENTLSYRPEACIFNFDLNAYLPTAIFYEALELMNSCHSVWLVSQVQCLITFLNDH